MEFTFDVATDIGKCRLIIPDSVAATAVFQDASIQAFLDLEGDVRRAAALALETIGSDLNLTLRYTRAADGTTVDGTKAAAEARARAKMLREQAESVEAEAGGLWDWAEWAVDDFSARERLDAELLRSGG